VRIVNCFKRVALKFHRQLKAVLLQDFNDVCYLIHSYTLSLEIDTIVWRWHPSGLFNTHSAYNWLIFRGLLMINAPYGGLCIFH
jgi:hypothetical protein